MTVRGKSLGTSLGLHTGIEQGPVFQHGGGNLQQSIRHIAKRSCMAVATSTQCSVLGLADGIVLESDAGPVVNRVLKAAVGRQAAHYNHGLAGASGDRRHAAEALQGLTVWPSHGVMRFCEQRGEDDPA